MALPHLDAAYNLARWLSGSPNDADDIVQDAYIRAFRFFDKFHGDNARPWLLTIVRRTWYTEWKRRASAGATVEFDENLDDTSFEGWSGVAADPETLMIRDEDAQRVHDALGQLPVEYREVLVLRELEELSYREIAAIADVPVGTVMSRLARGRRRLAAALGALQTRGSGAAAAQSGARSAAHSGAHSGAHTGDPQPDTGRTRPKLACAPARNPGNAPGGIAQETSDGL
ncbi:MAG TPA: RNA polymerase sigma factor [Paraburkholderia sp.]